MTEAEVKELVEWVVEKSAVDLLQPPGVIVHYVFSEPLVDKIVELSGIPKDTVSKWANDKADEIDAE
jgi:hypothetical protein